MQVHHFGVGERQHEGGSNAAGRADRAQQVCPGVALIPRCNGARAAFSPHPGQRALLANSGLVLPPELERFAASVLWQGCVYKGGEVASKDACAAGS
jgi:hypothetical protein